MKTRTLLIIATLIGVFLFNSCDKKQENEWDRFYSFTKDDIIGHYEANPDNSVYVELPTEGVTIYPNATIDISALEGNFVRLQITIPDVINKVYTGTATMNENDTELSFHNYHEDILMSVYKNKQNQIRLQGRERKCKYNSEGEVVDCDVHGFDVVKTSVKSSNHKSI